MKTYRHLHEQISDFANLYAAFRKARKGKRDRAEVADFEYNLVAGKVNLRLIPGIAQTISGFTDWCWAIPGIVCPDQRIACQFAYFAPQ